MRVGGITFRSSLVSIIFPLQQFQRFKQYKIKLNQNFPFFFLLFLKIAEFFDTVSLLLPYNSIHISCLLLGYLIYSVRFVACC